jgi:hypothetical protein
MRKLIYFLFVSLIAIFILSCPEDGNKETPKPVSRLIPDDFAGMCHAGGSSNLAREYEMLNEMGVVWLHWDFSWSTIQPAENTWNPGAFDSRVQRANEEGKKIMGMLLYGNGWIHKTCGRTDSSNRIICNQEERELFANYAAEVVKRYNGKEGSAGKVDAWLIWNEPDLTPRFWTGTREQFYELTKATAAAIRELDAEQGTHSTLLGGVFSPLVSNDWDWVTDLFKSGAMAQVDGIAFHPYSASPSGSLGFFNNFKKKVAPYGFADKIWVNEMGYPTYSEKGTNIFNTGRYGLDQYEGDMPEIAVKTFVLLAANGARALTWYHLFDGPIRDDNDSENWYGLVWRRGDDDWVKKGGYYGYVIAANNIPGKTYRQKRFFGNSVPKEIQSYYFEGNDGKHTLVVWNSDPWDDISVTIELKGSNHKLWDAENGESSSIEAASTYKLESAGSDKKTLLFITWQE